MGRRGGGGLWDREARTEMRRRGDAETRRRRGLEMIETGNRIFGGQSWRISLAFGGCVGAGIGVSREAAKARRGARGRWDRSRDPLGDFWWLMTAGPIERNFIPHSTTLARGRMSGNRWRAGLGVGLAAFAFGEKAFGAFGECVRRGMGISREAAKPRSGARGKADFDRINMMDMIFDGLKG